jgi:ParB family chromosome partitioning protein
MSGKTWLGSFGSERSEGTAPADVILSLSVAMLEPDPAQPRKTFDQVKLQELAESLKLHGQLQPVIVRRAPVAGRYQLVAGERRWRACKLAGIDRIRAVEIAERESGTYVREAQLVENVQREDMSPLETAESYRSLLLLWGVSQAELARRLAVDKSTVSRALALLQAPQETQARIASGESVRQATGTARRRKVAPPTDKRRAVELDLPSGSVRVKRGHTLEQLLEDLRAAVAEKRSAA